MDDVLTYHTRFSPEDFDAQYNLRARRPDFEETVLPAWLEASEKARADLDCLIDLPYGAGERQRLDLFQCDNADAPTLIYFHGGYWQRGDKAMYSFLASPFVATDVNVILVGYDLCPAVTVTRISQEAREAIAAIWHNGETLGINRDRLNVMGHSAGGHITQMMMATDWPALDEALPSDLVKSGIPISPISYLEPIRLTEVLNEAIRLDEAEAEAESPMTNHPPVTNAPQLVAVGGAETDEFLRQAQIYVDAYGSKDRPVELYIVPDADHSDVLNVLADSKSEFFSKVLGLMNP